MFHKYKVSEVCTIMGVTVKTLKHYDRIGLLVPDYRDEVTGYRYYTDKNINQLSYILILKQCGFSLSEIRDYFGKNYVAGTFIRELMKRRDLLTQHIKLLQDFYDTPEKNGVKEEFLPASMTLHTKMFTNNPLQVGEYFSNLLNMAVQYKIRLNTSYVYIASFEPRGFVQNGADVDLYMEIDADSIPLNIPEGLVERISYGHCVTNILHGSFWGMAKCQQEILDYCEMRNIHTKGLPYFCFLRHPGTGRENEEEFVTKVIFMIE